MNPTEAGLFPRWKKTGGTARAERILSQTPLGGKYGIASECKDDFREVVNDDKMAGERGESGGVRLLWWLMACVTCLVLLFGMTENGWRATQHASLRVEGLYMATLFRY